jgi:hypothetical protein
MNAAIDVLPLAAIGRRIGEVATSPRRKRR